jgi:hypothetical protein
MTFFKAISTIVLTLCSFANAQTITTIDLTQQDPATRDTLRPALGVAGAVLGCREAVGLIHPTWTKVSIVDTDKREYHDGDQITYTVRIRNNCPEVLSVPIADSISKASSANINKPNLTIYELDPNIEGDSDHWSLSQTARLYGSPDVPGTMVTLRQNDFVDVLCKAQLRYLRHAGPDKLTSKVDLRIWSKYITGIDKAKPTIDAWLSNGELVTRYESAVSVTFIKD